MLYQGCGGGGNISKFPEEDLYWGCGGGGNISKFTEEGQYLDSLYIEKVILKQKQCLF